MRILKYILLLLFLFSIGLTVFIATQKGNFDITKSRIIKSPRVTIFKFVNDYRNWETFGSWTSKDASLNFTYPEKTFGLGSFFSWKGNNEEGSIQTIALKENDSISQKMVFDGTDAKIYLTFKDTLGKTKVSWRTKGKMNLAMKFYTFLNGGINTIFGDISEKTLKNLDRTLDYELNTFNVKVNGIVSRPNSLYVCQTVNSYSKSVVKNTLLIEPKLLDFFSKNNVVIHGKPFVLYNSYDDKTDIANYSICIPIRDSIEIKEGSPFKMAKLDSLSYVKTTLTGDYTHMKAAKEKADEYILKNKIKPSLTNGKIEVYSKTVKEIKNPSKWVTELLIPIEKKPIPFKRKYTQPTNQLDSNAPNTVEKPQLSTKPVEAPAELPQRTP